MESKIEELRTTFLQELQSKGEASVHPKDLERVKINDDWLKRFLMHYDGDLNQAKNMLWDTVSWRKDYGTNEICENNVKMEILVAGGFFSHGRDKDGCALFIFKCKKYVKGTYDTDDIKRCVIYWMERLEREECGKPITLFFDMENCGLANMDMDFTKYLIGLFKQYYPYFLNYILIFEMPWILSAAFKVIKSWLPEKAVQKIKFINKKDFKEFVPLDQALTCWGGNDEYSFSFVPEPQEMPITSTSSTTSNNKKVHFADGSPMSETAGGTGDKDQDGSSLVVEPSTYITFVTDGNESLGTLELHNTDNLICLSYKFKTTSPEKFCVRPSSGCLAPGARTTITVKLLPGFQVGSLSRDKFLVMSTPVKNAELTSQELSDLWKNISGKKLKQHHLKCAMKSDSLKNGTVTSTTSHSSETDQNISQLTSRLKELAECQTKLHSVVKSTQYLQVLTIIAIVIVGAAVAYFIRREVHHVAEFSPFCKSILNP